MSPRSDALSTLVCSLVPSLARSLAEPFNVFQVMRHGAHEKQLSNVLSWLLRADATHGLEEAFQRQFVEAINDQLGDAPRLPVGGYLVLQEVDTAPAGSPEKDIADIVLMGEDACIVVENFEFSDGHGHDYHRYRAYGARDGRRSVVVLLCVRYVSAQQSDGWELAPTITYAAVLSALKSHIDQSTQWQLDYPRQHAFINELIEHFTEESQEVSTEDKIAFLRTMCETGESARYGHRPQEVATEQFAELVKEHAKRQFEEGRQIL